VGSQKLLQQRRLVGLVGRNETAGEYLLADVELALLAILLFGELSEPRLEQDLLGGQVVVASLHADHLALEGRDLRLGVVDRRSNAGQVLLRRRDLALERGLLRRQLGELGLLIGDQLGQALLFGDCVRKGVGPDGRGRSLKGEAGREQATPRRS
jgi:hypothetical protein